MIDSHLMISNMRVSLIFNVLGTCVVFAAMASQSLLFGPFDALNVVEGIFAIDEDEPRMITESADVELQSHWQYFIPINVPPYEEREPADNNVPPLVDVILGPEVFSHARTDLLDLRIFNSTGEAQPYALRTLSPKSVREVIAATEFDRSEPDDGPHELTLELLPESVEHNEIQIILTGEDFRRAVEVEGSEDGKQPWRRLVAANLIRFTDGKQKINVQSLVYENSRSKFIRVKVQPDPNPDDPDNDADFFKISEVKVLRSVEVPGERIVWDALVSKREPTRVYGSSGSTWTIDLQGSNVPCDLIEVEVEDNEFVRDVELQIEQPVGPLGQKAFVGLYASDNMSWQRKLGDPKRAMKLSFPEVQASRLRLRVADYRNTPLTIRSVKVSASARQVVFARPTPPETDLRLFFGNPMAELSRYDFARNLPENPVISVRAGLQPIVENTDFVPPPQPFTERFPWLIYVVLGSVAVSLMLVIANLARTAIALHDAESAEVQIVK